MLPDFPGIKTRLLRLASIGYRRRINADGLIGEIAAILWADGPSDVGHESGARRDAGAR